MVQRLYNNFMQCVCGRTFKRAQTATRDYFFKTVFQGKSTGGYGDKWPPLPIGTGRTPPRAASAVLGRVSLPRGCPCAGAWRPLPAARGAGAGPSRGLSRGTPNSGPVPPAVLRRRGEGSRQRCRTRRADCSRTKHPGTGLKQPGRASRQAGRRRAHTSAPRLAARPPALASARPSPPLPSPPLPSRRGAARAAPHLPAASPSPRRRRQLGGSAPERAPPFLPPGRWVLLLFCRRRSAGVGAEGGDGVRCEPGARRTPLPDSRAGSSSWPGRFVGGRWPRSAPLPSPPRAAGDN